MRNAELTAGFPRPSPARLAPTTLGPPTGGSARFRIPHSAFRILIGLVRSRSDHRHATARTAVLWLALVGLCVVGAEAIERFPPPDFETEYAYPQSNQAPARAGWLAWLDMAALAAALAIGALIALHWRSRKAAVWLSLASIVYFGFYRKGCVCPIGSIQNVAQGLADTSYIVPLSVIFFFTAPLLVAVFFGRIFCSGVCPFGAVQDMVLLRAVRVPRWLDLTLSRFRYVYLGLAILFAATGASYVICRYDPFVGFFRVSARFHIWVWSAIVVGASFFIGRPYCRYLCPYGALLALVSRYSLRRVTVTPDRCVVCGLCREACPHGAIREADPEGSDDRKRRRVAPAVWALALALPVAGLLVGRFSSDALSTNHVIVQTAERVFYEETRGIEEKTTQSEAFWDTGLPTESIYTQGREIQARFVVGSSLFGLWVGLVFAATVLRTLTERRRDEFEADRGECVACSRCYMWCPVERERRGLVGLAAVPTEVGDSEREGSG